MAKNTNMDINNLSDDYPTLKSEAVDYAQQSKPAFVNMAIRLKKIKDENLYEEDGYKSFSAFLSGEFEAVRRTAYNYIDLLDYYGVQTFAQNPNIQHSKLLPAMPLLKSDNPEIKHNYIKRETLKDVKNGKTEQEIRERVRKWKEKYGLMQDSADTVTFQTLGSELIVKGEPVITIGTKLSTSLQEEISQYLQKNTKLLKKIAEEVEQLNNRNVHQLDFTHITSYSNPKNMLQLNYMTVGSEEAVKQNDLSVDLRTIDPKRAGDIVAGIIENNKEQDI